MHACSLSQAWYNANINSFDPIDQAVVTAMYQYGVIVADLADGGLWLEGSNDQRWTTSELSALAAIPDSAFQVLDTIQSPVSFTGPTSGAVGVAQSYTLKYLISGDSNYSTSLYINVSSDGGKTWTTKGLSSGWFGLSDSNPGPFAFTFTPPAAGTYLLAINYGGNDWILPADITFTASASTKQEVTLAPPSQTISLAMTALPAGGDPGMDITPASITGIAKTTSSSASDTRKQVCNGFPKSPVFLDACRQAKKQLGSVHPGSIVPIVAGLSGPRRRGFHGAIRSDNNQRPKPFVHERPSTFHRRNVAIRQRNENSCMWRVAASSRCRVGGSGRHAFTVMPGRREKQCWQRSARQRRPESCRSGSSCRSPEREKQRKSHGAERTAYDVRIPPKKSGRTTKLLLIHCRNRATRMISRSGLSLLSGRRDSIAQSVTATGFFVDLPPPQHIVTHLRIASPPAL